MSNVENLFMCLLAIQNNYLKIESSFLRFSEHVCDRSVSFLWVEITAFHSAVFLKSRLPVSQISPELILIGTKTSAAP